MSVSTALTELSGIVDKLESTRCDVTDIATDSEHGSLLDENRLRVCLTIEIPLSNVPKKTSATSNEEPNQTSESAVETDDEGACGETDTDASSVTTALACSPALKPTTVVPPESETARTDAIGPTSAMSSDEETSPDSEASTDEKTRTNAERTADEETSALGSVTDSAASTADDLPPHRDPDQLRAVYDQYETFAEMTDALDTDVTTQTVRYHMIQHGIHTPGARAPSNTGLETDMETTTTQSRTESSSAASSDSAAERDGPLGSEESESLAHGDVESKAQADHRDERFKPPAERPRDKRPLGNEEDQPTAGKEQTKPIDDSDGEQPDYSEMDTHSVPENVTLPSHLSIEDIRDAVSNAQTLFEVQQDLRLGRNKARKLLSDLNLLDLVVGRASTIAERDVTPEEITRRLSQAAD